MKLTQQLLFWIFCIMAPTAQARSKEIVFIRHAESEFNTYKFKKILYAIDSAFNLGQVKNDADLSELGVEQASALHDNAFLQGVIAEKHTVVLSSNLKRAINTAIFAVHGYGINPERPKIHILQALQENGVRLLGMEFIIPDSVTSLPPGDLPSLREGIPGYDLLYPHYQILEHILRTYNTTEATSFVGKLFDLFKFLFDNSDQEIMNSNKVVIFGHSNWLKEFIGLVAPTHKYAKEKLSNCGILSFTVNFDEAYNLTVTNLR